MKAIYGIGVAVLALLVLAGAATLVKADLAPPPYDPTYNPSYTPPSPTYNPTYSVQTMQGFAMNQDSLDTEPVVFVRLSYGSGESTYLFIGDEFHRLRELNSQWIENGEVVRYSVEGMDDKLTLYSTDGFYSSASGLLGSRMLVFQPTYWAYPVYGEAMNVTAPGGIVPASSVPSGD